MQLRINAINVKIVVFIELNDKDAYCAHENVKDVRNVENIDAFMNMHQLKRMQINRSTLTIEVLTLTFCARLLIASLSHFKNFMIHETLSHSIINH